MLAQSSREKFNLLIVSAMISFLGSTTGCCCHNYLPVSDKIESFAVIGFFGAPSTVNCSHRVPAETQPFAPVEVWVYLCYSTNQEEPIVGRYIKLSVVDSFGEPVPEIELSPASVITNGLGLNEEKVIFDPQGRIGVFRIRAYYDDKRAQTISYSPPITVLSND